MSIQDQDQPFLPQMPQLTPTGRIPNTPLRPAKRERVALGLAQGKSPQVAVADARALKLEGMSFIANSRRYASHPQIRERVRELMGQQVEEAGVHAAYVLRSVKEFSQASCVKFWQRDADGNVMRTKIAVRAPELECGWKYIDGPPMIDFSRVTEDDGRMIKAIKETRHGGLVIEMHDPLSALDKLGRYNNLWTGEAVANANADASLTVQIVKRDYEENVNGAGAKREPTGAVQIDKPEDED